MRRWSAGSALLVAAVCVAGFAVWAQHVWGQSIQAPPTEQGRLRADRVRYDAKAQVFIAEGNARLSVGTLEIRAARLRLEQKPQLAFAAGNVVVRQPGFSLEAAHVKYEIRPRIAHAEGNVVLVQNDVAIRAPRMTFELQPQDVVAEGGVKLEQKGSTLSGQTLLANLRTQQAAVSGQARFVRAAAAATGAQDRVLDVLAQEETVVTAPWMKFRWDINEAWAEGGVTVTQRDKTARAVRVRYSEATGRVDLEGDVVVEQLSGEWLIKGGVLEPPGDEETRQALASKTTVTCERLVILLRERDMEARGKVTVTQKGRTATGDRATYTDKQKRIVVTGNVHMRDEDGNKIRADQVIISLIEETFEARGNVETEFRIKRSK
jgi:lipopolysaccharide assembly outer membrane protein LptD (OstA)